MLLDVKLIAGTGLAAALCCTAVSAQTIPKTVSQPYLVVELDQDAFHAGGNFEKFRPASSFKKTRLDYSLWDEALNNVVLDFGPSERKRAQKPRASVGSRFVKGHTSPYRLEGSRVTFSYIDDVYREGLTAYRKDLESIAERVNLPTLSRNEQLAYWFNLHNAALIEQIALAYPIDRPSNIKVKIDGKKALLDDAKFLTVMGENISLSDIRNEIVYKYWDDPRVIYGFFRGNIGSPRLPRAAYSSSNLDYYLDNNAEEFVNSLRGFHESYDKRNISSIYEEARSIFFPNFDRDLTAHLLKYAERDTVAEVKSGKPFKVDSYEDVIADLSAGRRLDSSGTPIAGGRMMSVETRRMLAEVEEKYRRLRADGVLQQNRGYVIIEDLLPENTDSSSQETE